MAVRSTTRKKPSKARKPQMKSTSTRRTRAKKTMAKKAAVKRNAVPKQLEMLRKKLAKEQAFRKALKRDFASLNRKIARAA